MAPQRAARLAFASGLEPGPATAPAPALTAAGELSGGDPGAVPSACPGGRADRDLDRPLHRAAPAGRDQPDHRPGVQRAGLSGAVDGAAPPQGPSARSRGTAAARPDPDLPQPLRPSRPARRPAARAGSPGRELGGTAQPGPLHPRLGRPGDHRARLVADGRRGWCPDHRDAGSALQRPPPGRSKPDPLVRLRTRGCRPTGLVRGRHRVPPGIRRHRGAARAVRPGHDPDRRLRPALVHGAGACGPGRSGARLPGRERGASGGGPPAHARPPLGHLPAHRRADGRAAPPHCVRVAGGEPPGGPALDRAVRRDPPAASTASTRRP